MGECGSQNGYLSVVLSCRCRDHVAGRGGRWRMQGWRGTLGVEVRAREIRHTSELLLRMSYGRRSDSPRPKLSPPQQRVNMSLPFASRALFRASHSSTHVCGACRRGLTISTALQSGHSKWATIKHDKAKNDAAKNKQRSVFSHEIILATKRMQFPHHKKPVDSSV